jgi:dienelactone hydrolase
VVLEKVLIFKTSREDLYYDEFATDLQAVIASVKRRYPTDKIGVLGFSMGTIIAFQSAKSSLDFIAADSPVASVRQTVEHWSAKGKTLRYPPSGKSLEQTIKSISIPIIIFAGKVDTFTPLDEAKSIVKGYETKRYLVEYSGGHLEGWKLGETYFSTLKNFVRQYCSQ